MNYFADLAKEVLQKKTAVLRLKATVSCNLPLRDDVKWHDGEPFDAEDVKFTYEMYMNPAVRVFSNDGYDKIENFVVVDLYGQNILPRNLSAFQQLFDCVLPEYLKPVGRHQYGRI